MPEKRDILVRNKSADLYDRRHLEQGLLDRSRKYLEEHKYKPTYDKNNQLKSITIPCDSYGKSLTLELITRRMLSERQLVWVHFKTCVEYLGELSTDLLEDVKTNPKKYKAKFHPTIHEQLQSFTLPVLDYENKPTMIEQVTVQAQKSRKLIFIYDDGTYTECPEDKLPENIREDIHDINTNPQTYRKYYDVDKRKMDKRNGYSGTIIAITLSEFNSNKVLGEKKQSSKKTFIKKAKIESSTNDKSNLQAPTLLTSFFFSNNNIYTCDIQPIISSEADNHYPATNNPLFVDAYNVTDSEEWEKLWCRRPHI